MNYDFSRTDIIQLHLKNNSFKKYLMDFMCLQSKAIFNSAVYFQRQMYFLRTLLIKFYIDNIDTYYKLFSLHDIIQIIKFISKKYNIYDNIDICKLLFSTILYKKDFVIIQKNIHDAEIMKILNNMVDKNKLLNGKTKIVPMDYNYLTNII